MTWVYLGMGLATCLLTIWLAVRGDRSKRRRKRALVFLAALAFGQVVVTSLKTWIPGFVVRTGALRPKERGTNQPSVPAAGPSLSVGHDSATGTFRYRWSGEGGIQLNLPEGAVVQPFGPLVPLSLRRGRDGLFVSAVITDLDGTEVGRIHDNRWEVYEGTPVRCHKRASALEVVGRFGVPLLQIDYINPARLKLQGVFRVLKDSTRKLYGPAEFPSEDLAGERWTAPDSLDTFLSGKC